MARRLVKRGHIVLVRYPFTDLTGSKVRPAVVLTPNSLLSKLDDVLCLFISSSIPKDFLVTDFILLPTDPFFKETGLKHTSIFRTHKLALLHKSLVTRVLGEMQGVLMDEINQRLRIALGL